MSSRLRILPSLAAGVVLLAGCEDERPVERLSSLRGYPGSEYVPPGVRDDEARLLWRQTSTSFRRPFALHMLGDRRMLVLDYAYPFLHLWDAQEGNYLYPVNVADQEGNEGLGVTRIAVSPLDPNEFAGYDLASSTITRFRLEPAGSGAEVLDATRLHVLDVIDGLIWHRDGSISAEPITGRRVRSRIVGDGRLGIGSGFALDSLAPDSVPPQVWRQAMDGVTCAHPDGSRFARAWRYMGRLFVLDSLGNRIDDVPYATFYDAAFARQNSGELVFSAQSSDVRLGYSACTATSSFVFALFSGKNARMSGRSRSTAAEQVHVYDWNGELQGGFRVLPYASSISITPDGGTLLVLDRWPDAMISAYEVPRRYRTRN